MYFIFWNKLSSFGFEAKELLLIKIEKKNVFVGFEWRFFFDKAEPKVPESPKSENSWKKLKNVLPNPIFLGFRAKIPSAAWNMNCPLRNINFSALQKPIVWIFQNHESSPKSKNFDPKLSLRRSRSDRTHHSGPESKHWSIVIGHDSSWSQAAIQVMVQNLNLTKYWLNYFIIINVSNDESISLKITHLG